jgi:hypothetical protein
MVICMKSKWYLSFLLLFMLTCTERYDADIDHPGLIPVIDAFIGNNPGSSYVKLSYSLPFDTVALPQKITSAKVIVEDNTKIKTPFSETSPGEYKPANSAFKGETNKTYTLTIETPGKEIYVSYPQKMLPPVNPSKISGGYASKMVLYENSYGQVRKRVEDVCEVYYDFKTAGEEIPRLRFTSAQIVEYIITRGMINPVVFYCWMTSTDNSLRFTNERYATLSGEISNQTVAVTSPDSRIIVRDMSDRTLNYTDSIVYTSEYRRIIRINHYRLNPASYAWYKGIESQSLSEGKIFDPLTSQLYGNFYCKSDPDIPVLGFFEVSPVTTSTWVISREGPGTAITFKNVPDIYPPQAGFTINKPPYFWIN